jgi:hypothetical protein
MSGDYKGVPEWVGVLRVAQAKAYNELQPGTADVIHAKLVFVASLLKI